jgi:hypothetical protein
MGYRCACTFFFEKVVLLIHGAKRRIGRFLLTIGLMGLSFTVTMERAACVTISHRYPKGTSICV